MFLGSEQGRRVLAEIMLLTHINTSSAKLASYDPYKTAFFDGERSVGIKLMMIVNTEPRPRPERANTELKGNV